MSLYGLQEAHPSYRTTFVPAESAPKSPTNPPASLQAAALRNPPASPTSLQALNPYRYQEAPPWYTSPHGPPFYSRALETFQPATNAGMNDSNSICTQTKYHLMACSSCRRQALMFMATDFMFYFLLGLGLIYASKRIN